jgi:hypothetical protein
MPARAVKKLPDNTVVVCGGSVCRQAKSDAHKNLCKALIVAGYDIKPSRCLGVCIGPVVAAPIKDRVEIVAQVRGTATIHDLTRAIADGKARNLRNLRVKGSKREKARRKALEAARR